MECESAVTAEVEKPEPEENLQYPRRGRLLRHADFERVYKQGRRHFSAHMTVFYLARTGTGSEPGKAGMRIGFTVSRALGGAVDRNRMKRRLRECVRACWLQVAPGVDVVVNPKKSLLTADFAGLQQEIRRAFEVITQKLAAKPSPKN
jgi:ribonuclease P protein component